MAERTVRMVVVMDVKVRANDWKHSHIEAVIETLMQALVTSAQHPELRNIDITKYAVHTLAGAYDELLKPWEKRRDEKRALPASPFAR